jgi:hypothetical protein
LILVATQVVVVVVEAGQLKAAKQYSIRTSHNEQHPNIECKKQHFNT